MKIEEAKQLAMYDGKKIRHPYFLDEEYLYFKNGKWLTEENIMVPYHYWVAMVPEMLINWEIVK